ncbi:prepilin peptidase [Profundibacterium mesophilum]|uniref:Type 4 prepilin-like protein leader peptide-processing enzyme Includes Leader peptidase n=1 Tax=Profundibacterium mesophilum KAUST100406-0324 TaxID=1037889 RepID=A0A921TD23_9RHOB|nr:A24 family peptidase [Profundibacterium mesophilum]KAF0675826.1 Type 4 prepilin-like protein leader peptide-processing enzyme Includes Leader peptidase [Profundibacterium mesophilum KAUST100406-0324]
MIPLSAFTLELLAGLPLAAVLVAIARIDLRSRRVPDALSLPLLAAGLILALLTGASLSDHLAGAVLGWAVFAAIGWAFWRLRGIEGLGLGDAKLLGAAGAWLGWQALPALVALASIGALVAALIRPRMRQGEIAFAPFLGAAFALMWAARLAVRQAGVG